MSTPSISVIVPVYNVMPYIHRCLTSICAQTFSSLEILLIDDGSTDESGQVCDEYAKKDSRIRVVHQKNQGISAARNKGLELATCDLVGFVDSDDWIEPDMYQVLYDNLRSTDADISVCSYEKRTVQNNSPHERILYNREEAMYAVMINPFVGVYAWNKLYKKELFSEIRYPVGQLYEDSYIILDLLELTERVVCTNAKKYHYTVRTDSITSYTYRPKEEDRIISAQKNLEIAKSKYPALVPPAKARYLVAHYMCLKKLLDLPTNEYPEKRAEHVHALRRDFLFLLKLSSFGYPINKMRWFYLRVICPELYCFLRHLKTKIKQGFSAE